MKVLIATLYGPDALLIAANKLGPEKIVVLVDKKPPKTQLDSLKLIKASLGRIIKIEVVKVPVYDIVEVARRTVEIIDSLGKDDIIDVNVTSGRKTKVLGLLYGAYARVDQINRIMYYTEEEGKAIYLPKLSFKLTESQKSVLEIISKQKFKTVLDLSKKMKMSRALVYRNIDELRDYGYIEMEELKLTDAGRVAGL